MRSESVGDIFKTVALSIQKGLHEIIDTSLPRPRLFHSDVWNAKNLIKKPAEVYKDGNFSKEPIPFFGIFTRTLITQFAA